MICRLRPSCSVGYRRRYVAQPASARGAAVGCLSGILLVGLMAPLQFSLISLTSPYRSTIYSSEVAQVAQSWSPWLEFSQSSILRTVLYLKTSGSAYGSLSRITMKINGTKVCAIPPAGIIKGLNAVGCLSKMGRCSRYVSLSVQLRAVHLRPLRGLRSPAASCSPG